MELEQTKPKRVLSDDQKKKMSLAKLRNPVKYWLGKKRVFTQEHKDAIKRGMTGKKFTPEHIKNMIASRLRNKQNIIK